jgi:hypothetical protein
MSDVDLMSMIKDLGDIDPRVIRLFNAMAEKIMFLEICTRNSDYSIENARAAGRDADKHSALSKIQAAKSKGRSEPDFDDDYDEICVKLPDFMYEREQMAFDRASHSVSDQEYKSYFNKAPPQKAVPKKKNMSGRYPLY